MLKRILILLAVISTPLYAQKAPMKLGKVSMADLEMKHYPQDTTVDAAVLCEYGRFNTNGYDFSHLKRIKIFSKEGLNGLIFRVPVEGKSNVRGFVINKVDGKIVKEKISKEHIFVERSHGASRVRVAPPNAHEGSIIDIAFFYDWFPSTWQFQQSYPVRYSELYIPEDVNLTFRFQQVGYEKVEVKDYGWYIAHDMPAFNAEPYINSSNNYKTGLLIDLVAHHITTETQYHYKSYTKEWSDVNKLLMEDYSVREMISWPNTFLNKVADEIKASNPDREKQIEEALKEVHKHITWNGTVNLFPGNDLRGVWEDGEGTSSEMNYILISLLTKMDIDARPIIISQRSSGRINPDFPTLNRFNSTLCFVNLGPNSFVIDASDKYSPPGMLPYRSINEGGLVLDGKNGSWFQYFPGEAASTMHSCNLSMNNEGDVEGELMILYKDYSARDFRNDFSDYGSEEDYIQDLEKSMDGMYIEDYKNNITDSEYEQVVEELEVNLESYASAMGDIISFNPVVFNRTDENPFRLEARTYPVDFATAWNETNIINIKVPEGYEIDQLPETLTLITTEKTAVFQYIVQKQGNMIQLMIKRMINKPIFYQPEYQELKLFFEAMYNKEQERIVLKKVS